MGLDIGGFAKRFLLAPLASAAGSANRWADNYSFGGPNWREKARFLRAEKSARLRYLESQIEENNSKIGRDTEMFNLNKELTQAQLTAQKRREAAVTARARRLGVDEADMLAADAQREEDRKTAESGSKIHDRDADNETARLRLEEQKARDIQAAADRKTQQAMTGALMASTIGLNNARAGDLQKQHEGEGDQIQALVEAARRGELTQESVRGQVPKSLQPQFNAARIAAGVKLMSSKERNEMDELNTLDSDLAQLQELTKSGEHTGWQGKLDNTPIIGELMRNPKQQQVDALTMRVLSTNLKARSGAAITGSAGQKFSELQRGLLEFPTTGNTDSNYQAKLQTLRDALARYKGVQGNPVPGVDAAPAPTAGPIGGESLATPGTGSQIGRFLVEPE